jgi:hypothetical protein
MARLWARREDLRQALNDSIVLIDAQNLLLDGMKEDFDKLEVENLHLAKHRDKQQEQVSELWHKVEELETVIADQLTHMKTNAKKVESLQMTIASMLSAVAPDGAAQAVVTRIEETLKDALHRFRAVTGLLIAALFGHKVEVAEQPNGYTFFAPALGYIVMVPPDFASSVDWNKLMGKVPISGFQVGPYAATGEGVEVPGIPTVMIDSKLTIDKIEWGNYTISADKLASMTIKYQEPPC